MATQMQVKQIKRESGSGRMFANHHGAVESAMIQTIQPHSCYYCYKLELDFDNPSPESRKWLHERESVFFALSLRECVAAAKDGCALLAWIIENLDHKAMPIHSLKEDWPLVVYVGHERDRAQFGFADMVAALCCGREYHAKSCWSTKTLTLFRTNVQIEDLRARVSLPRPIVSSPKSDMSLAFAAASLDHCLNSGQHKLCRTYEPRFIPKRLVKISRTENDEWGISLLETQGSERHPYVALSYCWGGEQPVKTTKANLEQYRISILPSDKTYYEFLPSTIQDAIFVTAKLGVSYLWIDAFCICQDDAAEKALEISLMPSIYQNAIVTIVAANSAAVYKGFLGPRTVAEDPTTTFQLRWRGSGDSSSLPPFQPKSSPTRPFTNIILMQQPSNIDVEEPLNFRAWAMQERMLAPRVLEYGTHRLRWICPSAEDKDCTDGWTARRKKPDILRQSRLLSERAEPRISERQLLTAHNSVLSTNLQTAANAVSYSKSMIVEELNSAVAQWHEIVEQYTAKALSVKTDRILAISGISERFNALYPGDYMAGLWLPHLPGGLLWKSEELWQMVALEKGGRAEPYPAKPLRPQENLGPSWSWVSIDGKIEFEDCRYPFHKDVQTQLKILSTSTDLAEVKARYGAVNRSAIILRARMRSAQWINDVLDESRAGLPAQLVLLGSIAKDTADPIRVHIEADCLEEEFRDATPASKSIPVYLIEVLEQDIIPSTTTEIPQDDDFLDALLESALGPGLLGKPGGKTFSDFLTPKRYERLMAAQKPMERAKSIERETRGLVLRKLADGTYSRLGTFRYQWEYRRAQTVMAGELSIGCRNLVTVLKAL